MEDQALMKNQLSSSENARKKYKNSLSRAKNMRVHMVMISMNKRLSPIFINFSILCSNYSMNLKNNGTKTKIPVKFQLFPTNGRKNYKIPSKFWNIPSFSVEVTVGYHGITVSSVGFT